MPEGRHNGKIVTALQLGFLLVLIGVIFQVTPNLSNDVSAFSYDLRKGYREEVFPGLFLPSPLSNHPVLYDAAFQFSLAFAAFQVVILSLEFLLRTPIKKKAGAFSGAIFWFGLAASFNMLKVGSIRWVTFLSAVIVAIGTAILVRSLISLLSKTIWKKQT